MLCKKQDRPETPDGLVILKAYLQIREPFIKFQEQNAVLRIKFFFGSAGQDRFLSRKRNKPPLPLRRRRTGPGLFHGPAGLFVAALRRDRRRIAADLADGVRDGALTRLLGVLGHLVFVLWAAVDGARALDVAMALSAQKVRLNNISARSQPDGYAVIYLELSVKDQTELAAVINKLAQIAGVYLVRRAGA